MKSKMHSEQHRKSIVFLEELARDIDFQIPTLKSESTLEEFSRINHCCALLDYDGNICGLNLSKCGLTEMPMSVLRLTTLKTLRFHGNSINTIPAEIALLSKLERVYLSNNRLQSIPTELFTLPHLKILGLNGNGIGEISNSIISRAPLRVLSLAGNPIKTVPEFVLDCKSLESLHLDRTEIRVFHWSSDRLPNLKTLTLSAAPLEDFQATGETEKHLLSLSLSGTRLVKIPKDVFGLVNLELLDISKTQITSIDKDIELLLNLRELNISESAVRSLPSEIGSLTRLSRLSANGCPIRDLPESIAFLQELKELELSGTNLGAVPPVIVRLHSLERIDLSMTKLKEVPQDLLLLPYLSFLNLAGNHIRSLPAEILRFPLFVQRAFTNIARGLALHRNPLESPPLEILTQGPEAIAAYFDSLSIGTRPLNEIRLLFIGDGGAGKTSLVRRLLDQGFDKGEAQTDGINIGKWNIDHRGRKLLARIWDFGGQEIMHATHQFFLSRRSLYVLVIDSRKDQKVEYWLKHIKAFGASSPVLVVINKIDENPGFDLNRRFLSEQHPNIVDFFRVSCLTSQGLSGLRAELERSLARLRHGLTRWPLNWFDVKSALEVEARDYIGYHEFRKICERANIADINTQKTLIRFLNDLGIILHFSDLPLRDTNVINPTWITSGVYAIINSPELAEGKGVLPVSLFSKILDEKLHPFETHNFLVELMKKFEICYALDEWTILIPSLLSVEEPPTPDFEEKSTVRFALKYDFLPKSVIARFIVRMHSDIVDEKRWRTGALLQSRSGEARAFVRSNEDQKSIEIRVDGEYRRDYLAVVVHALRVINSSFSKMAVNERVPLPDNPFLDVGFQHLLTLESKGVKQLIPEGTTKEYQVSDLLGRITYPSGSLSEIAEAHSHLKTSADTEETLLNKLNEAVLLRPNFFGLGIDLNAIAKRLLRKD